MTPVFLTPGSKNVWLTLTQGQPKKRGAENWGVNVLLFNPDTLPETNIAPENK